MRNTVRCWDTGGTFSLQKQPIQTQYIRADPLGVLCRVLPAIFYMAGAAAVMIWVRENGSNITAVFVCPKTE